jgi:murein DD-endopeptidase MepM/ murein hydrolase activator NlpD
VIVLRLRRGTRVYAVTGAAILAVLASGLPAQASTRPAFQMPFPCKQRWDGSTRPTHSPSPLSIDWTRDANDYGQPVVASAAGTVTSVVNLGDTSYGRYIVIDHGAGWSTLFAHLSRTLVAPGQWVDQGQVIALLGTSGGSTGPHLHYEQRLNRTDRHAVFAGTGFVYNTWLTSLNCLDVPVTGDWNGDRVTDVGVFLRAADAGIYRQRLPDGSVRRTTFGQATDEPVIGDWNGDGQSDLGVWTPLTHTFTLALGGARLGVRQISLGTSSDVPVAGDWDGDGRWDVGVWKPGSTRFVLRQSSGLVTGYRLGTPSSIPLTGDWNGDGSWDVGMYDPATSTFTLRLPDGSTRSVVYGEPGSLPVVGFYNAGAVSDLGVWNPSTGVFSERLSAKQTTRIRFGRAR